MNVIANGGERHKRIPFLRSLYNKPDISHRAPHSSHQNRDKFNSPSNLWKQCDTWIYDSSVYSNNYYQVFFSLLLFDLIVLWSCCVDSLLLFIINFVSGQYMLLVFLNVARLLSVGIFSCWIVIGWIKFGALFWICGFACRHCQIVRHTHTHIIKTRRKICGPIGVKKLKILHTHFWKWNHRRNEQSHQAQNHLILHLTIRMAQNTMLSYG